MINISDVATATGEFSIYRDGTHIGDIVVAKWKGGYTCNLKDGETLDADEQAAVDNKITSLNQ